MRIKQPSVYGLPNTALAILGKFIWLIEHPLKHSKTEK